MNRSIMVIAGAVLGLVALGQTQQTPVLSMTKGLVYRLKLSNDGRSVIGDPQEYFRSVNRYRDIAMNPDHRTFYLSTDLQGRTTDSVGANTQALDTPGTILEFKYTGGLTSSN